MTDHEPKIDKKYFDRLDENGNMVCPFCVEGDFDRIGLANHFLRGWCEEMPQLLKLSKGESNDQPRTN